MNRLFGHPARWIPVIAALVAGIGIVMTGRSAPREAVQWERVPDGGVQPQLAIGSDRTVHLVYFKGEPRAGDLFYCFRGSNESRFSPAIRVNSAPASAIAVGTIRGAQIAVGKDNRVHIAWNGSDAATPRGPKNETPLLYARLNDSKDGFEPQRNLIEQAYGLDGGACVAANGKGSVYVAWHAGTGEGEGARRVWLVKSADDGATFGKENAIDSERVGACGCCGMRGSVGPDGEVQFLYRSAREDVHRDIYLLTSSDAGASFASQKIQDWEVAACPMSSEDLVNSATDAWAGWESDGQVYFARLEQSPADRLQPIAPRGAGPNRKHPRLAASEAGAILTLWTEGTGWNRGGDVAWQLLDKSGRATLTTGKRTGVPTWSFAAAFAKPDGSFVVLY